MPHDNTRARKVIAFPKTAFLKLNANPINSHQLHLTQPDIHTLNNLSSSLRSNIQIELNSVLDPSTENLLEFRHFIKVPDRKNGDTSISNDIGRLVQGVGTRMTTGTNIIFSMHASKMPKHNKITYFKLSTTILPLKTEVNRVKFAIGGDR